VRLADHARRLNLASGRTDLPPLILMSDARRLPDPSPVALTLPRGAAVLVRHGNPDERRALVERVAPLCRARELRLIVADDLALASEAGAFGLHLPESTAACADALRLRRSWKGPMLSVAAHSPRALKRAAELGADAALVSPVFATQSHPEREAIGVMRFLAWCRTAPLPVYALGGITAANAGRLSGARLVGIAGIGGFV